MAREKIIRRFADNEIKFIDEKFIENEHITALM